MSASLDSDLDPMEEIRYRKKHGGIWAEIQKSTHFTFDEIEKIMIIFFKIQKRDEKPAASDLISRSHFRDVLHTGLGMTDSYMMERVMVALDRGTSPYVTMATFAKAFSLYLRGNLEERITYAFTCYDLLGEGYLRRETMYQLMKKSLAKASRDDDVEEAVKEFVDIMLKRMDADLDGVINFNDFSYISNKNTIAIGKFRLLSAGETGCLCIRSDVVPRMETNVNIMSRINK